MYGHIATVAFVGIEGSSLLDRQQAYETKAREEQQAAETNLRMYTELMSKRSALYKTSSSLPFHLEFIYLPDCSPLELEQ